jgi:hypothetical protein
MLQFYTKARKNQSTTDGSSAVTATTTFYSSDQHASFSNPVTNSGSITAATNFSALVTAGIVNGANAGTVVLQAAAN